MDPLSISASALAIAEVCFRIVQKIHKFQHDLSNVDQELKSLADEVESLRGVCIVIKDTFSAPSPPGSKVDGSPDGLWEELRKNMANCDQVVLRLATIIENVCGTNNDKPAGDSSSSSRSHNLVDRYGKVSRRKKYSDELRRCRTQLDTYGKGLQLLFSYVTMNDTRTIKDQNDQHTRSFRDLAGDLRELDSSIRSGLADIADGGSLPGGHQYDAAMVHALRELKASTDMAAASVKEASTNKHFDTPQSVSSIFTGREALLDELRSFLVQPPGPAKRQQRRFVIQGLGGSGKTQFCCKFADDNRDSFWGVFWVDASTEERLKQTLGALAKNYAQREKSVATALHWLSNLPYTWLLIIDNADDPGIKLEKYFPRGNRGSILITTKSPTHILHGNVGPGHYDFQGLDYREATSLLLKASSHPAPWDTKLERLAAKTAETLGCLALAIIHAGAAISQRLCTLKDYPGYFDRSWRRIHRDNIRRKRASDSASNDTVYATWELCYERLLAKDSEAAVNATQLLKTFAFFHWENISPEILLRAMRNAQLEAQQQASADADAAADDDDDDDDEKPHVKPGHTRRLHPLTWLHLMQHWGKSLLMRALTHGGPEALPAIIREGRQIGSHEEVSDRINDALNELSQMSLLIHNDQKNTYFMHPIVHRWARERFVLAEQMLWADVAGRVLAASILLPPLGTTVADDVYHTRLHAHVDHVQQCRAKIERLRPRKPIATVHNLLPAVDTERIRMLSKFSYIYAKSGAWTHAEVLLTEVVDFLHQHLGRDHSKSRQATMFLSTVYFNLGRGPDAKRLETALLKTCIKSLGPDHTDTLRTMERLGHTLWQLGHYTDALSLQKQATEGLEKKLGPEHPDTLNAIDHLGLTVAKFWTPEDMQTAYKLHRRAVDGMTRTHGPGHERTLFAKENVCRVGALLGGVYFRDAPATMQSILATRRAQCGREHPFTLLAMVNTAIVQSACGEHARAEELLRDGLTIASRTLEENHIGTLFGLQTLACVLNEQRRCKEALEILSDITDRQKSMHSHRGEYHPDRLVTLIELAKGYYILGDAAQSLEFARDALRGFESISTLDHPLAKKMAVARDQLVLLVEVAKDEEMDGEKKARGVLDEDGGETEKAKDEYDLHGTWDIGNQWTGAYLNAHTNLTEIHDSFNLLWRNGVDPAKVNLGLTMYGRSTTVASAAYTAPGCPYLSGGDPGACNDQTGILLNSEIEAIIAENGLQPTLYTLYGRGR
ncbi:hypothetical protein SPBR_06403 [Sporothrix brasiliensis 5110]|uniref:Uncharacterized protein n=1 Tax=Sporothrix brasiliensis 5110 TaxID=1398154 RepID=A0A0C2ETB8_9PEZI|nr:uncharacterized protein SPBR_06403 [Sporothrix brasiliensis 5110]KIH89699.1 hypothetical protein SPBR_06403 [Sporothrix brasiliensis 5110]